MESITGQMALIREMVEPHGVLRGSPFQVLIKTILSHRTKDENTDAAADRLFAKYPTPVLLKDAPPDDVERLIRSTGFYTVKAARVIEVSRIVDEELGGIVPRDKQALMELPGVGPKTANCVLVFAYGDDAIPVDTHVHRIANRIGWVSTRTAEETEPELERVLPKELWAPANELLVSFGKLVCKPQRPRCEACLLTPYCAYFKGISLKRE